MIYGSRVRHARQLLGETQTQFAAITDIAQSRLSTIENGGTTSVAEPVLLAIAEHAGFPPGFFERPPAQSIDDVQFRSRMTFKAADRNSIMSCAEVIHESYMLMRQQLKVVPVNVSRMGNVDPRQAAREFRAVLGLPSGPISNLTFPIEKHGIVILALPIAGKKHDAFSWWQDSGNAQYPVLTVLAGLPGDRLRWTTAHELGHLLMHMHQSGREIELEADLFAAELLTPLDAMRVEMPRSPKLSALYAMKVRWGVSVQSLIRRAREIEYISDTQYMSLFRQVSARGERMNERYQLPREKPRVYRRMAEVLFGESPATGLSHLCSWTDEFAEDVLEQYAHKSDLPSRRVLLSPNKTDEDNVIQFRRPSKSLRSP